MAGLISDTLPGDGRAAAAALTVPVGTTLVLTGYFVDDVVELARSDPCP